MTSQSAAIGYWLIDFYALATVVLLATVVILGRLNQPARRLSVAWSASVGLVAARGGGRSSGVAPQQLAALAEAAGA